MWGIEIATMKDVLRANERERELCEHMRQTKKPAEFREWSRDRVEAARHRALVQAIEDSRPRGFGLFW